MPQGDLSFPLRQGPLDQRAASGNGSLVAQGMRGPAVGAVEDQVIIGEQPRGDAGFEGAPIGQHAHMGD